MITHRAALTIAAAAVAFALAACAGDRNAEFLPSFNAPVPATAAPVIRQPVLPEMLVSCRGHVLVPALGMAFVPRGAVPPAQGQYLREESLTPPYRVLSPGVAVTREISPQRLNVELDRFNRIVGLFCG